MVLTQAEPAPGDSELRQFLRALLPEPMIPSAFVVLETFPLTQNGKVNRDALPSPGSSSFRPNAVFVAPSGPLEEEVASIWGAVLGLQRVGAQDNFFDLGGHSLLATQVISRLREATGVDIPLRALFESPTVARMAERIEAARQADTRRESIAIKPSSRVGPQRLSFSQEALWFLDQLTPGQPTFNVTAAVRIKGPLDQGALKRSASELVRRHESLRTSFVSIDGTPHQIIEPKLDVPFEVIDLTGLPVEDARPSCSGGRSRKQATLST